MTAPTPEEHGHENTPDPTPPAPESHAVPNPDHTPDEQRTNMLTALEELGQLVSTGLENVNRQIAELRGANPGTDETPGGVPWTHRGKRRP